MTLEIIVFITCIVFGVLLYWRESRSNKIYRFLNKLMYSESLQIKPKNRKGFIYNQNFLMRLVYISLLFLAVVLISKFFLPIEIATIQLFISSIIGTIIGTYLAGIILRTTVVFEEKSENLEDLVNSTLDKGKEIFEDLKSNQTKFEEVKEESKVEKKSARARLKDKGLM